MSDAFVLLALVLTVPVICLAALVALLVNAKTRKGTLVFLGVAAALLAFFFCAGVPMLYFGLGQHSQVVSVQSDPEPFVVRRAEAPQPVISRPIAGAPKSRAGGEHLGRRAIAVPTAVAARPPRSESMISEPPMPGGVSYVRLALLLAIVVVPLAALAALLSNDKTRKGTLVFLGLAGGLAAFFAIWFTPWAHVSVDGVSRPVVARRAEAPPVISKPMAEAPQPKAAGGKAAHAASPAAAKRPAWVDSPPGRQGDAYRETVLIGPYTTRVECDGKVPETLQRALAEYAELYLGRQAPPASSFSGEDLEQAIVKDRFEETIHSSVGPMIQLHLLLEFDRAVQERIQKAAERAVIDRRLWRTGTCSLAGLGLLAVALAYLKADLATGGAHRRRLRLGAMFAAALLLFAAWLSFRVG